TAIALILSCGDDLKGVRDRALLMFFLSTGTRREGVATLTMDRLDLQRRFAITHEKGNKHHLKPFDPLTADAINEWIKIREPEAALFYNLRTRQPLTGSGIRTIISKIALANGIEGKTNPHGWRHLFALLYHQAGGSIASLSKLLGHANSKITAEAYLNFAMETALDDYERLNPMQRVAEAFKQHEDERSGDSNK
ncbi:MAG TPA: tyrosine-type recombinase/integrase, partial [Phototrophicaceae bacterium]|nr:tyrosine-type recombinase/integrase [Phototrophicaceae bacterium]